MNRAEGFTLVELMIVILIMGILVGIAVPVYVSARSESSEKVCMANLRTLKSAAGAYGASAGTYPTSVSDLYPDYLDTEPICPGAGDSSPYEVASGGGDVMTTFTCTYHGFTR